MQNIKSLKLVVCYPVIQNFDNKNSMFNILDTISIYYLNGYVVYKLSAVRQLENNHRIKGSEPYFIYRIGSKKGMLFDSISQRGSGTYASIDSILFNRAYTGLKSDLTDTSWKKVESIRTDHSLLEKFAPNQVSANPNMVDTVIYYYNKELNGYNYSFSKKADSNANMKLCQIKLLYNAKMSDNNKLFQARELFIKIEKNDISDYDSIIMNFVKRYDSILKGK